MAFVRSALVAVAVVGMTMCGEGLAQNATPDSSAPAKDTAAPAKDSLSAKVESKAEDVSKWTTKEWNKAKSKWAKEKEKWADCQKQSKDQGLTGRKSWSFLASCMTS
jgi:hypothetical protein